MNFSQKIKDLRLPWFHLLLAIVADVVDIFIVPAGYFTGFIVDSYLYFWAKRYIGKVHMKEVKAFKKKLRSNYFIRIVAEFIPILNFLPMSTLLVLKVWSDKRRLLRGEYATPS